MDREGMEADWAAWVSMRTLASVGTPSSAARRAGVVAEGLLSTRIVET
jgi:hypothetical protein